VATISPCPNPSWPKASGPTRAFGCSLSDFGELSSAEKTLLECCRFGTRAVIAEQRPEQPTESNRIRAAFVRFLSLGGDDCAPSSERGIELVGAWLIGPLDLQATAIHRSLALWHCVIDSIEAYGARVTHLALDGSRLMADLLGDRLVCDGGVFLRNGFCANGAIRLPGARISSDLDCSGGRFEAPDGQKALVAHGAQISGGLYMRAGFHAIGEVHLLNARIGGNLDCNGGRFEAAPTGFALIADGTQVNGDVTWANGFHATGQARLLGARIAGDLDCDNARFEGAEDGVALGADRAQISGTVFLRDQTHATGEIRFVNATIGSDFNCSGIVIESQGRALHLERACIAGRFFFEFMTGLRGSILLGRAKVGALADKAGSWAPAHGSLDLDGFSYDRFIGDAPTDAISRIEWLDAQFPDQCGSDFRPQPWENLIGVLRAMGHPEEARKVAIAKQDRLRSAGKIVRGARTLHFLYGLLVGYGYRPLRLLITTASIWLLCAGAYWAATNPQWFGSDTHLLAPPPPEPGHPPRAPDYSNFVPLIYSADVLLPVVDLGYKKEWQPVLSDDTAARRPLPWGQALRFLYWFEIAFGWVAGLLLVGVVGSLIKKD
jgi:hypothetical protein